MTKSHHGSTAGRSHQWFRLSLKRRKVAVLIAVTIIALSLPMFASSYQLGLVSRFMVFAILALSLDILWGYTGVVSFGHAMFFGLGAYATAITLTHIEGVAASYLALSLGIFVPAFVGLVLGSFLFYSKVSGVYFGIVTLALTVVAETIFIVSRRFSGGLDGLYGFAKPTLGIPGLWSIEIWGVRAPYYAALAGLVISLMIGQWLVRSSFGIVLRAIRDDEDRVELLGISKAYIKTVVLTITCALAGFGGAIYTTIGFVSPQMLGIFFSTQALVWVAIGGRGTLWGPIIGAFFVGYLETSLSGNFQEFWPLLVGIVFVGVVLAGSGGIFGLLKDLIAHLHRMRTTPSTVEASDR